MSLDHATLRPGEEAADVPPAQDAGLIFIGRVETPWVNRAGFAGGSNF